MMANAELMQGFLNLSSDLTGFSVFDLRGTGEAEAYLEAAVGVVGVEIIEALVAAHAGLNGSGSERDAGIRREILGDPKLGPVARSVIKLWFAGVWYALPKAWVNQYGPIDSNSSFAIRPSSYPEGLLWKTIGANPPGAKAPGYGSWAEPPRIPDPDQGFSILTRD